MRKILNVFIFMIFWMGVATQSHASLNDLQLSILKEDFKSAKELAQSMLAANPDKLTANQINYYLAVSHLRLLEHNEARAIFNQLTQSAYDMRLRDKAYLGLFDSYYLEEQYNEALKTIEKLLRVNPKTDFLSLAYLKLARVSLKLAHWNEAREYLDKIVNHFPYSLEVYIAKQLLDEKQYFAVQLGSFTDRDLAEKLVDELKRKSEYAYVIEITDPQNKKFYRVRVGQLASLEEAQKLKGRLAALGYPTQIYP